MSTSSDASRMRCGAVAGRQHERDDALDRVGRHPGRVQGASRPFGAARLVVGPADGVHRVVKPERELDLGRLLRVRSMPLEQRQALAQMLERVVVALRRLVRGLESARSASPSPAAPMPLQARRQERVERFGHATVAHAARLRAVTSISIRMRGSSGPRRSSSPPGGSRRMAAQHRPAAGELARLRQQVGHAHDVGEARAGLGEGRADVPRHCSACSTTPSGSVMVA